jgi:hypothetical protein
MAAAATAVSAQNTFGVITLDGIQYIERPQIFPYEVTIFQSGQVITNLRLTMPGHANFLLKGLSRDCTRRGAPASQDRRFRFRMWNTQGSVWFFSGGLGIFDDRVVDTLCFGSGQFPFPLIPPVPVNSSGTLFFEIEDMGLNALGPQDSFQGVTPQNYVPYTIYFGFHGSYLIPVQGS